MNRAAWYAAYPWRDARKLAATLARSADDRTDRDRDRLGSVFGWAAIAAIVVGLWVFGVVSWLWLASVGGFIAFTYISTRETFEDARRWELSRRIATIAASKILTRSDPRTDVYVERVVFTHTGALEAFDVCYPSRWDDHVDRNQTALVDHLSSKLGVPLQADWHPEDDYVRCTVGEPPPETSAFTGRPKSWPQKDAHQLSLWEPIPVGFTDTGEPFTVNLVESNILFGGEPGSGKSNAMSLVVATAALDPASQLVLFDGTVVDLAVWEHSAEALVGPDIDQAIAVLELLIKEVDRRTQFLRAQQRRKIARDDGMPLILVACDELAYYTRTAAPKKAERFSTLARDVASRGRKVGIIMALATQKPSSDTVPTSLRDMLAYKAAFRCTTPEASDTILGRGWAARELADGGRADASRIDPQQRGVFWLLAEAAHPVQLRAYLLSDAMLRRLAKNAATVRRQVGPPPHRVPLAPNTGGDTPQLDDRTDGGRPPRWSA